MGLLIIILLGLSPSARLTQAVPRHSHRILLVEDEAPGLKRRTREELSAELIRLEAARPSLVTPSVLLGLGLGLGAISLGVLFTFHDFGLLMLVPAVVFAVAAMLVIVGGVTLAVLAVRRAGYSAQIDRVQLRLDDLGRRPRELPPPPPSPNAGFFGPAPRFVLAVF